MSIFSSAGEPIFPRGEVVCEWVLRRDRCISREETAAHVFIERKMNTPRASRLRRNVYFFPVVAYFV